MQNATSLRKVLTLLLFIALTVSFNGCTSVEGISPEAAETLAVLEPPMPLPPETEQVVFEDRDEGLWLSYDNYRALERNIISLREYSAELENIIGFYRNFYQRDGEE